MKYLVMFTTPVEGGWKTAYVEAMAIVEADHKSYSMPYGWNPEEIAGLVVDEVRYIIPLPTGEVEVISREYDRVIPLDLTGETAIIINDDNMGEEETNGEG